MKHFLLLFAFLCHASAWAHLVEQGYTAARVVDGGTVVLTAEKKEFTCRLHGVNAPENDTVMGQASRESLSELVQGRDVHVHIINKVERNVLGCRLFVNGKDIGREQVRRGMAKKFQDNTVDAQILHAENNAKAQRLGIWSDIDPATQ